MSEVQKGTSRNTENENKRCKIFNKVLNMNWDYVRVKKKQKENKNKQTKRKHEQKKMKKKFIRQFGSVFNKKKMVKSVIYLLFRYQTGYIM
jgi:hypothetical protein